MNDIMQSNLIKATEDGYTPFIYCDASVFVSWIKSLMEVLSGDGTTDNFQEVHGLVAELAIAADALIVRRVPSTAGTEGTEGENGEG